MIKVGITGQAGFVGTHLYNYLGLQPDVFERVPFEDVFFDQEDLLRAFVKRCDVIVHLAAMNRHPDPAVIYDTNIRLVKRLILAMEHERVTPHVLFSSSTQEERDNEYGKSKRDGRTLLEKWAQKSKASFTGMVVPNVYGPFGRPNHNSFIATFCYKLTHGETPEILQDSNVKLIYSDSYYRKNRLLVPFVSLVTKPKSFDRFFIQAKACLAHNAYDKLCLITCPTLVIGGEKDMVVGGDASRQLAAAIKNSALKMYSQWGHGLYEEARDFADTVAGFFE